MDRELLQQSPSLDDIREYVNLFKKKFQGFKSRAPIFFTFQVSPLSVFIQVEGSVEITEFKINYDQPVEDLIYEIRAFLRDHEYPKLQKTEIKFVEPDISDINRLTIKKDITFDEAFKELSSKKKKTNYIIDKIDITKNKAVLLEVGKENSSLLYQVDMPILVLLRRIKRLENEREAYEEFMRHAKKILKKDH